VLQLLTAIDNVLSLLLAIFVLNLVKTFWGRLVHIPIVFDVGSM